MDAILSRQGIAGTVTDSSTGQPIENCDVIVWGEEVDGSQTGRGTQTGADGSYDFESLPVTDVHLEVFCGPGYLHEWYLIGRTKLQRIGSRSRPRTVIGGIDLAVDRGGEINGTVTLATDGSPAGDVCVQAWVTGVADPQGSQGFAITDDAGRYTIDSLPTGDYAVSFFDCGDRAVPLAQEFFDAAADYFTATPVHVQVGGSALTVDATLEVAGAIAGQIVDPSGEPVVFSCVEVFTPAGWSVGFEQVGLDGRFSVGFLHQGDYQVFFDADPDAACGLLENQDLASEWYDDAPDRTSAALVHVDGGQTTTIEGHLEVGGSHRRDGDGRFEREPAQACVTAYRVSDGSYARGTGTRPRRRLSHPGAVTDRLLRAVHTGR